MIPALHALIDAAIAQLRAAGTLPADLTEPAYVVERPQDPAHGDFATNAALVLARPARSNATKHRLLEMEKQGRVMLFFPDEMRISNTERNLDKLKASYYDGLVQTDRQWDRIMEFLGA